LKVLISAVAAKSGGAETYVRNLVCDLPKRNADLDYVLYVPDSLAEELNQHAARIEIVGVSVGYQSPWKRLWWDQITLRRIVVREKIDVLFSTSDFGMLFAPCEQLLFVRNGLFFSERFQVDFLPHRRWKTRFIFRLQKLFLCGSVKCADKVMVASQSMLESIRRTMTIPQDKAVVNHFGVPLNKFSPKSEMEYEADRVDPIEWAELSGAEHCRISYIAEYADYKDFGTLLEAIGIVGAADGAGLAVVLTIRRADLDRVDASTRDRDKDLLDHPRVEPLLRLVGAVPYEKVESVYRDTDIFLFPSLVESFGHPLVEAMASGLPIIASDTTVNREVCGDAAVYFNPQNAADLAQLIVRVREDVELRRKLRENGLLRVRTIFDWEQHVTRLIDVFNRMEAQVQEN
jgi:glycosyltransferase involved in cell wall biosynthesis